MRAKRSKHYKRAMALYTTAFKFRQPYQVLVDAEFVKRMAKQKLDPTERLEGILGGSTKIMITQCCVSRLYAEGQESQAATDLAKTFERRKCNHWKMKDTDAECIAGIMGNENRYRYCVATQSAALRGNLRRVPGVPLLFEKRGMVLLEPPSDRSVNQWKEIEESKLHVPAGELAISKPKASTSKIPAGDDNASTETAAAPSGATAVLDLPTASRSTAAAQPNTVEDKLERAHRSRKRKREPNPLSVKKKGSASAAQPKEKRTKTEQGAPRPLKAASSSAPSKKGAEIGTQTDADKSARPHVASQEETLALPDGTPISVKAVKEVLHPDPSRGLTRPQGDGQSKKAMKRKRKNAEKADQTTTQPAAQPAEVSMGQ